MGAALTAPPCQTPPRRTTPDRAIPVPTRPSHTLPHLTLPDQASPRKIAINCAAVAGNAVMKPTQWRVGFLFSL